MIEFWRALVAAAVLAWFWTTPSAAAAEAGPTATPAQSIAAGLKPDDVDRLLRLLEDPTERSEFITRLRLLRQALETGTSPAPSEADPLDLAGRLFLERVDVFARALVTIGELLSELPALGEWLSFQLENEYRRALWRSVFFGLLQAIAAGALVAWLVVRWLGRTLKGATERPSRVRAVLRDLLPTVAFAATAGMILDLGGFLPATARIGRVLIAAIFIERVLTIVADHLTTALGEAEGLASKGPAGSTLRSLLNSVRLAVLGYASVLVAGRLGLPPDLYDVGVSALTLLVATTLSVTIWVRRPVLQHAMRALAGWIETDFLQRLLLLDRLAGTVHLWLIGLVWLNATLLVLGFGWGPARATVITLAILLSAHLLLTWVERPRTHPSEAAEREEPQETLASETPGTRRLAKIAIKLVAALAILEAWGIGLVSWLSTRDGWTTLEKIVRIGLVLGVSWGIWRLAARWIDGYVAARDAKGDLIYSNRVRTLATIGRSAILVVVALFALATILAELGVQTAPLLAGAGVIGLAIGFGSQKLVQDVINGLFILFGDTIRVGDVVELGGKTGVVEAMTIRTVTLRSYNGDVHTIPFGTIDRVTNMTRDFSYWVLDLQVAYHEDIDRVVSTLFELEAQMRREWPWRRLILAPLEVSGVDQFGENGVIIRARLKTRPGEQWRVGRELNRRIKRRFDELGIEIPFPQRKIHLVAASPTPAGAVSPAQAHTLAAGAGAEPRG